MTVAGLDEQTAALATADLLVSAGTPTDRRSREHPPGWEIGASVVALLVYLAAAAWMYYGMRYEIGDAISRTADARAMLFSRDPHLAAMGFVWLPWPVFAQLPAMLILSPLRQAGFSGPLTTAIGGAITVYLVGRMCGVLNVPRRWAIVATGIFALNPVVVFTAANGMSEEWFWVGAALSFVYLFRWTAYRRPTDLGRIAIGGAICAAVRYESLPFLLIIALLAAVAGTSPHDVPVGLGRRAWRGLRSESRRAASIVVTVLLPAVYVLLLWTFAQVVIEGDPFFWLKAQQAAGHTLLHSPWLPRALTTTSIIGWTLSHVARITPAAFLLAVPLVVRRPFRRALTGLGLLLACWFFPVLTAALLVRGSSSGDPRYLEPGVLFVTVAAIWLMSEIRLGTKWPTWGARCAICGVLALGAVTATFALSNPYLSYVEQVNRFFGGIRGLPLSSVTKGEPAPGPTAWQPIARDVDQHLAGGGRVLIDDNVAFALFVYTRYPDHYLITADRDYQSTLSDPSGRFTYVVQVPGSPLSTQIEGVLTSSSDGTWRLVRKYIDPNNHQELAELWQLHPLPTSGGGTVEPGATAG
jgi:hypothetical protein